jgi:hypothetical protein
MMHMPKSFQWEITGLMFTFLISSLWLTDSYFALYTVFRITL